MRAILKIDRETDFLPRENCTIVLLDQRKPDEVLELSKIHVMHYWHCQGGALCSDA